MVWIHGGAFMTGSATSMLYGPDYLLAEDIVFVSMNYRLGTLGISDSRYVMFC
jgi:carboxylesterase type B